MNRKPSSCGCYHSEPKNGTLEAFQRTIKLASISNRDMLPVHSSSKSRYRPSQPRLVGVQMLSYNKMKIIKLPNELSSYELMTHLFTNPQLCASSLASSSQWNLPRNFLDSSPLYQRRNKEASVLALVQQTCFHVNDFIFSVCFMWTLNAVIYTTSWPGSCL